MAVDRFSEMADVVLMRYRLEPDPGIEFVSPSSLQILGYRPDEFYDTPGLGLEIVHPNDRERLERECARDPEATFVGRAVRKDGRIRWIERRQTKVLDAGGRPTHLEATLRDVTLQREMMEALRESQIRFRTAFERAPTGMALVATDGSWLEVNQAFCEFLGYTEDELRQTTWQALTYPDDLNADLASVAATLEGRIDGYTMVKRYVRKDGEVVAARLTVGVVRAPDGEPRYFISQVEALGEVPDSTPAPPEETALSDRAEESKLTPRQLEILQLLADGNSTTQIAELLHLSKTTVRNHIANALSSLDAHTRLQALIAANRLGVIRMPDGAATES